jgi:DNA mismatch repair protein MutL
MSSGKNSVNPVRILPQILSDKIAAGEVVERPASVVKELLENALDANATRIIIEIEQGGRTLIRVSDNGVGMSKDDALLSIERYATSKIADEQDLFSIQTLGFRGEALPSIASVSKFCLETRNSDSETGVKIVIEGGKLKNMSDIGAPVGTQVTAGQLFFNTPARRKFLKSISTEIGHIADTVANIALSRPDAGFKLFHNGKPIKSWSASESAQRIADVLGNDVRESLLEICAEHHGVSVSGMIVAPRISRTTSGGIYIYVNGRCVRDRMILHALSEGYSGRLMKGQFPTAVVFIALDPELVDVNVHPAKSEVRFAVPDNIHEAVRQAVSAALQQADRPKWTTSQPVREAPQLSEPLPSFSTPPLPKKQEETSLWKTGSDSQWFSNLRIIGQIRATYILCESEDGLILIDQHAAHERILFERLKKNNGFQKTAQRLLIPETIELNYSQIAVMEKLIPELNSVGFEIEPFGKNTVVITSAPAFLKAEEIKPLIFDIIEKMIDINIKSDIRFAKEQCLMLIACHSAIRANQILSNEEIRSLLSEMDQCDNPSHCPHGRPSWIQWTTRFLEKSFGRTE